MIRPPPISTLFPYPALSRSLGTATFVRNRDYATELGLAESVLRHWPTDVAHGMVGDRKSTRLNSSHTVISYAVFCLKKKKHTSELQSHSDLVCRLLLEKKKT